jgi:hypothetical protein
VSFFTFLFLFEEPDGTAVSALGVRSRELSSVLKGQLAWVTKIYYVELRASEGTLSRWSRVHLQSLAPTPVSRSVYVRQAAGLFVGYSCCSYLYPTKRGRYNMIICCDKG